MAKSAELLNVTEVKVGGVEKFVAADVFGLNNSIKFYLWDDFKRNFLGKVEQDVKPAMVAVHKLEKPACDSEIMAELGIDEKTKKGLIKLAHFYELIKAQAQGREGTLLVNGYANIAYIEDENGDLWAVIADWSSVYGVWGVYAYSVAHPRGWDAGSQVVSQV